MLLMVAFASCWKPDGRQTKIVAEIKGEEVDYLQHPVGPSEKLRNSNLYNRSTSARFEMRENDAYNSLSCIDDMRGSF